MKIKLDDLEDFARGAAFLGTGGGGDPYIGKLLARHAITEFGDPIILDPEDLADDALVFCIAMLGAPTVLVEKAANGDDIDLAIKKLADRLGRMPDALIPIEIGGINSTIPLVAAARTGIPLVNADGMGRAFPEIQMVTFNVYGHGPTPLSVVDEHLNSVVVDATDAKTAEDLVRSVAIQMGLSVMTANYPITGKVVKDYGVKYTLTLALEIGRAIAKGRRDGKPVEALISYLKSTEYYQDCGVLFDGKVVDLKRTTEGGFSVGHCHVEPLTGKGARMEITFQNEHLIAHVDGKAVAMVPDLICVIDRETAEPIPVEALRYGQRIKVVGASVPPIMRTPEAIATFGPRAFGLEQDYVPIRELLKS
ncbi:DUF917 domain-containing protein [Kordiimonas aquimaris]|uniref:DUF917 domain-containing protein n=1 Tax=Kordiimonas aquimaris TaxID=707591 RepID=UPI0021D1101D|nr:DUF917 domain-containing protein [Kordiimonas aquimaris]